MTNTLSKMHQRVVATPEQRAALDAEADRQKAIDIVNQHSVPPNAWWDDANRAYGEINASLDRANHLLYEQIEAARSSPERRARIKDEAAVASNLNLVTKDILACRKQLATIARRHEGKSGGAKTAEEAIEVMEINDLYRAALTMYNSNVMPVVAHTLELLGEDTAASEQSLQQQAVMADKLESLVINHDEDPKAVTDVAFRDVTPKNNG